MLVILGERIKGELGARIEGGLQMALEAAGVAIFQPSNWIASIKVGDLTADVVLLIPFVKDAKYVMVWPDIKGDVHVPTALPGSPF